MHSESSGCSARSVRSGRRRLLALAGAGAGTVVMAGVVTIVVLLAGSKPVPDPVAATVPVALSQLKAPDGMAIGVIVTLGQGRVEGSEWGPASHGAVVAQHRIARGGSKVTLLVEDDRGSAKGGAEAVARLAAKGVSGIVVASSGPHVAAAASAASEAGIPLVLPYASIPADAGRLDGVWSMAPGTGQLGSAMKRALAAYDHPLLLDLGGESQGAVVVADALRADGRDLGEFADDVARRAGADRAAHGAYAGGEREGDAPAEDTDGASRVDALVIDGHPQAMADLVAALEFRKVSVPIVLGPSAVSPVFTQTLGERGGAVSSALRTVGSGAEDTVALGRNASGRAMSAYLQALRQLADDAKATNLSADAPFADVASWADVRSHDAVIALVSAASKGGGAKPENVRRGLADLKLTAADGVAGADLDFADAQVVSQKTRVLHATSQQLGLRPHNPESLTLSWFSEPAGE
ncbi:hypothetical protein [Leifsonia sp. Le1]|uniref:hypothetical protein n=1 Tax=Leifsonia sp. Le1 TaxID=3404918 RepID=UPI003EB9A272